MLFALRFYAKQNFLIIQVKSLTLIIICCIKSKILIVMNIYILGGKFFFIIPIHILHSFNSRYKICFLVDNMNIHFINNESFFL